MDLVKNSVGKQGFTYKSRNECRGNYHIYIFVYLHVCSMGVVQYGRSWYDM